MAYIGYQFHFESLVTLNIFFMIKYGIGSFMNNFLFAGLGDTLSNLAPFQKVFILHDMIFFKMLIMFHSCVLKRF